MGLDVVLPEGDILQLGGRYRKSTWGYDLLDLLIGSEGTLGIFTRIIVNLVAPPKETMDLLVSFPDTETAIRAVSQVIVSEGVIPETAEFMDRICLEQSCIHHEINLPVLQSDRAEAFLIIQLQGDSREKLEALCEKAGQTCMSQGALDVFVAVSPRQSRELWKAREQFSEGVAAMDPHVYFASDIVVPFSKVPELMKAVKDMEKTYATRIPTVGHIADGNIHSGICKPEGIPPEQWPRKAEEIFDEMTRLAIRLGGVGSGEHGVGMLKRSTFLATKSETELALMRGIKKLFDPNGILNPGKII
jgi:glycolate oxidase